MRDRWLLLFDIDGTLLHTHGAGMRAMARVAKHLFGEHFSWEGVSAAGNLDARIYRQAIALNGVEHCEDRYAEFQRQYVEALTRELDAARGSYALPGMASLIDQLVERRESKADLILGLLTGNFTASAPLKLAAAGFDAQCFEVTAFGDEAADRRALCGVALKKHAQANGGAVDPQRVIVIGDTPHDVDCAKANGCIAFAVATGAATLEELRATDADHVVPSLEDPAPLLRLLDG